MSSADSARSSSSLDLPEGNILYSVIESLSDINRSLAESDYPRAEGGIDFEGRFGFEISLQCIVEYVFREAIDDDGAEEFDEDEHEPCRFHARSRLCLLEAPNLHPHALKLHIYDHLCEEMLKLLRPAMISALTRKGSRITLLELSFCLENDAPKGLRDDLFRPLVFQALSRPSSTLPDNDCQLRTISFIGRIPPATLVELLDDLCDTSRPLQGLSSLHFDNVPFNSEVVTRLDRLLSAMPTLEAIQMYHCPWDDDRCDDDDAINRLATVISRLKRFEVSIQGQDQLLYCSALERALCMEENRLRGLHMSLTRAQPSVALPLALTHPNSKLKRLALTTPDFMVPCLVLNGIKTTPNSLVMLSLSTEMNATYVRALTESLLSRNNRVVDLSLGTTALRYSDVWYNQELRRAIRVSNVQSIGLPFCGPFIDTFKKGWFNVLVALTSAHHLPRLVEKSALRMFPMMEFIVEIAHTLGWKLEYLA